MGLCGSTEEFAPTDANEVGGVYHDKRVDKARKQRSKLMEGEASQTWFDVDAYAARYMSP